jgi:prevent-host-death family protein
MEDTMKHMGAFEAKTRFGELLDIVEAGEEVTISRRGKDVARMVPLRSDEVEKRKAAFARIMDLRAKLFADGVSFTTEELIELKNEGRR